MTDSDGAARERPAYPTQDRPATVDDILRLGMSIKRSHEEMTKAIVAGLNSLRNLPHGPAGCTSREHTAGEHAGDADDEGPGPYRPLGRNKYARKRRSRYENNLSVRLSRIRIFLVVCILRRL